MKFSYFDGFSPFQAGIFDDTKFPKKIPKKK